MKQFLITVLGVFFGLALFAVVVPLALIAWLIGASHHSNLPAKSVLSLDLRQGMTDQEAQDGVPLLSARGLSVMGVEAALRRAQGDARITGLFVRLPDGGMTPAAADELRTAFQSFRAAGKPILAYSQGIYPGGVTTATYELGAASGNLWMQPSASFEATGLAQETPFFKDFFDKYGISADYQQRYEFKNAVNPYLYNDYTAPHREAELSWMGSVYATSLAAAAQDRKMAPDALQKLIEAGPYTAEQALAKGLVDHVGELGDATDSILKSAGDGAKFTDISEYAARAGPQAPAIGAPTIAVIQAEGDIVTGAASHGGSIGGGQNIYADDVTRAFYDAIEDKTVKAIVFRVSSPGGGDTASEEILAAVRAARAAGKPVVVSMGDYGASGGYWIASDATEIVAEPSTLTGSIGVFGGKFVIGPALAKFGVDLRGLKVGGDYADAFGDAAPMTPTQRAAFSATIDQVYNGFVGRVAEGRHLPVARVEAIARGRVWTGAQAKALGLVDELGGFPEAVVRAKALAGITGAAQLKPFATSRNAFAALARLFGADVDGARLMAAAGDLAQDPQARQLLAALHDVRLRDQGALVLAPDLPLH